MPALLALVTTFLFIALLLAFPRLRDRGFKGRNWMLARALFPSWRFFEQLGHVPKLSLRMIGAAGPGPWTECLPPEPRGAATLFLNPRGNLRMACNSLVEQLVTDLGDIPDEADPSGGSHDLERLVSYELVERLVRFQIQRSTVPYSGEQFQFRILAAVPGAGESLGEEILVSSVHRLRAEADHGI